LGCAVRVPSPPGRSRRAVVAPARRQAHPRNRKFLTKQCALPSRLAPYRLRPITAPSAAGAPNQTVSMSRNPAP
jgi:hypothetical protein